MKNVQLELPVAFQRDVSRAIGILKESGCTAIFLYGSLGEGKIREKSDIDIAIQGCPKGKFYSLLGKLLLALDHSVDLVNLDSPDPFARYLENEGRLLQVG